MSSSQRNFRELLEARWAEGKFVCVGLDPDTDKMPEHFLPRLNPERPDFVMSTIEDFLLDIVSATADFACAFKPNAAFFESVDIEGGTLLYEVIRRTKKIAPEVPIILDGKRGDIGNTNEHYARWAFDRLGADAITIHPYLGREANEPFLKRADKGIFILCRTSNKGAGEFQDVVCHEEETAYKLHERVALNVASNWNANKNCGLVVGATYPEEARCLRLLVGDLPFLIPGIGTQGGDLVKMVASARFSNEPRFLINSSSGILYASSGEDYAEAARSETEKLHKAITAQLQPINA